MRRAIDGERAALQAEPRPRTFGVVPSDRDSHWLLQGSPDIQLIHLHRGLIDRVAGEAFGLEHGQVELTNGLAFADPMLEQVAMTLLVAARENGGGADSALYADSIAHLMAMHLPRRHSARPVQRGSASDRPLVNERRLRHVCDFIESALRNRTAVHERARPLVTAAFQAMRAGGRNSSEHAARKRRSDEAADIDPVLRLTEGRSPAGRVAARQSSHAVGPTCVGP